MENDRPQKPMYSGSWTCSKCGSEINQLPFEPDPDRLDQLLCRNCYRPKNNFRRY